VKHPESKEGSKLVENSLGIAKWIVRPGWTKEHSNPFQGVGEPTRLMRRRKHRKGYKTWEAAAVENSDLENTRRLAMPRLKNERNIALIMIVGWQILYFKWGSGIFPVEWMDGVIHKLFTLVSLGFYFKADYLLVMFDKRIIGMTFWGWVRLKIGVR
jgi:hypothetical protein